MVYRNKKILSLAKECPYCMRCGSYNYGNVVAAHRNEEKGMGMKAPDCWVAYLCHECHNLIDNGKELTKEERRTEWLRSYAKSMLWLFDSDKIKIL